MEQVLSPLENFSTVQNQRHFEQHSETQASEKPVQRRNISQINDNSPFLPNNNVSTSERSVYSSKPTLPSDTMHTLDNFGTESGAPKGSRLAKYMGASAARASSSTSVLNANVPSFVPKFTNLTVSDPHAGPHSQASLAFGPYANGLTHESPSSTQNKPLYQQEVQGGTVYFFQNDNAASSSIVNSETMMDINDPNNTMVNTNGSFQYHGPLPHLGKFRGKGAIGNGIAQFITPELRMELANRQLAMECRADSSVYPDLPQQVEHLNLLVPLENINHSNNSSNISTVFRAHSVRDGVLYCIRRIHNYRLSNPKALQPLESWKKLSNAHVAQLRDVIPNTRAFGDSSLIFVYDYYPLADTLKTRHFGRTHGSFVDGITGLKLASPHSSLLMGAGVPEALLWTYVIQLSAALRAIHANGLAARCVDVSKILVHGKNKVILSGCGQADLLTPIENSNHLPNLQNDDMFNFGRVILCLATGNAFAARRDLLQQSMQYLNGHYSVDMKNLILYLLASPTANSKPKTVADIMPMIGARFYTQLENTQLKVDTMENELSKEMENGRLFRLLCKLNTIVERPEHNMDISWAETGDRFLLKLFRDYVFHQVHMESGKPWLDMAHFVQVLNKLDAGVPEKIELASRDGDNLIIVSYGDLKRCIESAFRDLTSNHTVVRH